MRSLSFDHAPPLIDDYFRLAKVLAAVMRDQNCKVIIFAQTKKRVDDFFYMIKRLGYPVFPIHGDKRQQERDRVLYGRISRHAKSQSIRASFVFAEFRNRSRVILIATDVAARGLGTSRCDFSLFVQISVDRLADAR